ncbi:carbon-nitrogen hydrolase family protein [Serpentinicella alkaliphila]|uniref:Putative amidohydrolase n=1 Tax=Serpentinicella alkaliphila TaxID=1734049 RepID=A0A4R2TBG6_9FIRM|nr:carbon-nitrogen hydrolase family protein [Serpentinicella alkaliphila]QUH26972.1 carbon-nitrogen hydrolase family protein [Serpentinicella alkaliphila]TCQ00568.1 putative amidohydrolase [Serpentinicella alkaliphila]
MSKFNIAICQMNVTDSKRKNLENARKMVCEAVKEKKADIIVLPEMFNCPYDTKVMSEYAEEYDGETSQVLAALAKELDVYIIGGSIPEKSENKLYNTSLIFDNEGAIIGRHRKVHLFDVDIENGIRFKESDVLCPGNEVTVVETKYCKIGVAICFDIRFPELMRSMVLSGAEIIVVPGAFNMITGPAHWDALIKVRAIDNQVYFIAASPARNEKANYIAYGHSAIVNPWGEFIAWAEEREQIICSEIDLKYIEKVRNELPLLKNRRESVYSINS